MPRAYYNEIDSYCADWLRNLISANLIAPGDVDERPIQDVRPSDLHGYTQCHFFAGIGGWSFALRLAAVPDHIPIWTGSCPCQPFSAAGKRGGFADERHLWPYWQFLIEQRRPAIVFGEQVASPDGRKWLAGVRADMEALGAVFGAADLCAAGVGAPHIRQRLYWVAHADGANSCAARLQSSGQFGQQPQNGKNFERLGVAESEQRNGSGTTREWRGESSNASLTFEGMGNPTRQSPWQRRQPWQHAEAVECDDGWRRIEPGAQPLAHGISARLDKISGYGNAIEPQTAACFIQAACEALKIS